MATSNGNLITQTNGDHASLLRPLPLPMDIDDSVLGVDRETQVCYQWTYEQLELIRAHRNYYYDMLYFLEGLENVCAYFTEKNLQEI